MMLGKLVWAWLKLYYILELKIDQVFETLVRKCDDEQVEVQNMRLTRLPVARTFRESFVHLGVVQSHEDRVDNDTEGDEQVNERVKDEEFDDVWDLVPVRMTLPTEQEKFTLLLQKLLLVHAFPIAEQACKRTSITAVNIFNL